MDAGLGIAGIVCVALAAGHTTIGRMWVLPALTEERVPRTPFGPPSMTVAMLRVTWYVVTIFALGTGGLLLTLAVIEDADPRVVTLRWIAGMWLAATAMSLGVAPLRGRNVRNLMRLPVPVLWVVVAALCWWASA